MAKEMADSRGYRLSAIIILLFVQRQFRFRRYAPRRKKLQSRKSRFPISVFFFLIEEVECLMFFTIKNGGGGGGIYLFDGRAAGLMEVTFLSLMFLWVWGDSVELLLEARKDTP